MTYQNETNKRGSNRISRRIATVVLALATVGAMTAAHAGKKVEICHYPPGNPENAQTISVAISAWTAHEAHGDTLGECPPPPPESGPGETEASGGGGAPVANSFVVVLCDGRKGEKGRSIEISDTGRAVVNEAECE